MALGTCSLTSARTLGSSKCVVAITMALARASASARSAVSLRSSGSDSALHEDARADEHGLGAKLHHQRGVGGSGDASGGEVRHRQLPCFGDHLDQLVGRLMVLGGGEEFLLAHHGELLHLFHDLAHVLDGVDDVAGAGLALGANHGRAFGDAAQGLAQVARAADEWRLEGVLVNVVLFVGGSEHFGLVDVVDADLLQDLRLGEVSDAALGHHGDRNRAMICLMSLGLAMRETPPSARMMAGTRSSAMTATGAGLFGDFGLRDAHDVHDDSALEHFGEADLEAQTGVATVVF